MKSTVSAIALASVIFAPHALSADIHGSKGDPTSSDYISSPAPFQGAAVSVELGGQFTNLDIDDQFDGIGADGLVGGGSVEYLFGVGGFRVGPYVNGGISNVNTEIMGQDIFNQDWFLGAGIKGGPVVGNTLIYGKLGYEISQWTIGDDDADADVESVVVGGGVETMIADHVSLGLEAVYAVPLSVEVESHDVTELLEESESLRVVGRVSYRH
jgi:hypothetical protein